MYAFNDQIRAAPQLALFSWSQQFIFSNESEKLIKSDNVTSVKFVERSFELFHGIFSEWLFRFVVAQI